MEGLGAVIMLIFMFILYFLPTGVATIKHKKNGTAIFILNLFLGWTFIGWILALVRATTQD